MELLIAIIISGMAVGYLTEIASYIVSNPWIKVVLTLGLSFLALWLFGYQDAQLFIGSPAAGFLAAALVKLATRPIVVNSNLRRR